MKEVGILMKKMWSMGLLIVFFKGVILDIESVRKD